MDDMLGFESGGWDDLDWRDWAADTWGGGGYDWSGMPSYSSPETGGGGFQTMGGAQEYFSPADVAPGSGMYSVGGGDWNPVQSMPQAYSEGMVANQGGTLPGGSPMRYTDPTTQYLNQRAADQSASWANHNATFPQGGGSFMQPQGGGGPRAAANQSTVRQPYQQISMGTPERTMYDLYTGILKNPSQLNANPAYEYLYNQGMQSLGRSLAAKRMQYSGNAMQEFQKTGQGIAANFANQMIPQYQAGAREELSRFMGPAGLLPQYAASNNSAIGRASAENMAGDSGGMNFDPSMFAGGGGGGGQGATTQIGMGGISQGYNPVGRMQGGSLPTYPNTLAAAYKEPDFMNVDSVLASGDPNVPVNW